MLETLHAVPGANRCILCVRRQFYASPSEFMWHNSPWPTTLVAAEMASWRRLTQIHHAAADAVFAAEVIGIPFPIFGGRFLFSLAKAGATCSAGHGEGPAPLGVGDEGGALDVAML